MDWPHLFSANEGLTRTAAIVAFGAGSLYVLYSLLDNYITSAPPPPPVVAAAAAPSSATGPAPPPTSTTSSNILSAAPTSKSSRGSGASKHAIQQHLHSSTRNSSVSSATTPQRQRHSPRRHDADVDNAQSTAVAANARQGRKSRSPPGQLSVEESIELVARYTANKSNGMARPDPSRSGASLQPHHEGQQQQQQHQQQQQKQHLLQQQEQLEEQASQLTELVEELKYKGARAINEDEVDCLGFLLTASDESLLCEMLGIVSNCAAFTVNQNLFREHGVLNQVKRLSRHDNDAIKVQALNATINLSVNDANQDEFVDEIPYYLELAFSESCSMISLVALCVLTNLTVKHGTDADVLNHTSLLASKAICATPDQSLQAMKILVNVSCEEAGAEHLADSDIREDFFDLIGSEPAISQRCLTIVANLIPKIAEGSRLENRMIKLKGDMLSMWRRNELEDAQKEQLRRALKALSVRGWGRLSESTMDLVNSEK